MALIIYRVSMLLNVPISPLGTPYFHMPAYTCCDQLKWAGAGLCLLGLGAGKWRVTSDPRAERPQKDFFFF